MDILQTLWEGVEVPPTGPAFHDDVPPGRDLADRDDVETVVRAFYRRALCDPALEPVFTAAALDLETHLPIMCDFWQTVLFRAGLYHRNLLAVHLEVDGLAALTPPRFARWLALWDATVDEHYAGPKAELAKVQAGRIAASMRRRLLGRSASEMVTLPVPPAPNRSRHRTDTPVDSWSAVQDLSS